MKQLGFTLMLFVVVLSPLAAVCQSASTPTASTQAASTQAPALTPPDKEWRKIQKLPQGTFLVVGNTYGPPLACRMAAATDDALFCDAPESPGGGACVPWHVAPRVESVTHRSRFDVRFSTTRQTR